MTVLVVVCMCLVSMNLKSKSDVVSEQITPHLNEKMWPRCINYSVYSIENALARTVTMLLLVCFIFI